MWFFRMFLLLAVCLAVTACSSGKFKTYNGPAITHVVVHKNDRRMYLLHHDKVLESYDIDLGFAPSGDKQIEGDGKTPEGLYYIDRRNPNSRFHLSIGISYPNAADRAAAHAIGKSPGGDIFIHGTPKLYSDDGPDWTWGCIAVTDSEIEDIYAMVRDGTPITIRP